MRLVYLPTSMVDFYGKCREIYQSHGCSMRKYIVTNFLPDTLLQELPTDFSWSKNPIQVSRTNTERPTGGRTGKRKISAMVCFHCDICVSLRISDWTIQKREVLNLFLQIFLDLQSTRFEIPWFLGIYIYIHIYIYIYRWLGFACCWAVISNGFFFLLNGPSKVSQQWWGWFPPAR